MKPEDASELEHIEQALQQLENDMTDLLCEGVLQHLAAVSVTDTSFMTVNEQILQELRFKNNLIKLLTEDFQVFLQKKNIKPQDPINPEIIEYAKTLTSEFDQKFEKLKV
ncbi:MAG: hypothetical protein HWD59_10965 [Coxiellaceae bacterium]|nr:MAG: hypothetical protein HWD59_10965 [Coxiellaceae bacterium]